MRPLVRRLQDPSAWGCSYLCDDTPLSKNDTEDPPHNLKKRGAREGKGREGKGREGKGRVAKNDIWDPTTTTGTTTTPIKDQR